MGRVPKVGMVSTLCTASHARVRTKLIIGLLTQKLLRLCIILVCDIERSVVSAFRPQPEKEPHQNTYILLTACFVVLPYSYFISVSLCKVRESDTVHDGRHTDKWPKCWTAPKLEHRRVRGVKLFLMVMIELVPTVQELHLDTQGLYWASVTLKICLAIELKVGISVIGYGRVHFSRCTRT